jgi:hypothetical protein
MIKHFEEFRDRDREKTVFMQDYEVLLVMVMKHFISGYHLLG